MKIFAFDPSDYQQQFAEHGFVHIPGGIDAEFLEALREFRRRSLETNKLDAFAIKGKKEQSLYEFPDDVDFPDEIFDVVAAVCGLNRPTMTLSERHIQAYEENADPNPQAHKDRFPSQVSLGFSIDIPAESTLVLYPYDCQELNPFNKAAALIRSLQPHELPEVVLKDAREVEIDDQPGDVVMFHGSTTWHLRRNAARAVNLYVKLNDFDYDPLGEDPSTPARRERTLELLGNGARSDLAERVPAVSRRLDFISRQYAPRGEHESLLAVLYGGEPFGLTPAQLELLRIADGQRSLGDLVAGVTNGRGSADAVRQDALTLLERGALDLVA
jgi:hypothetical protein